MWRDNKVEGKTGKQTWYANIVNYLVTGKYLHGTKRINKLKIRKAAKNYAWIEPYLWRLGSDQIIRKCVPDHEVYSILIYCHNLTYDGQFDPHKTTQKVLDNGFYWTTIYRMLMYSA